MNRKKWLFEEIEKWQTEQIISSEAAAALRQRYVKQASPGMLILLFSIIGAVLIGIGIILISAKNWYELPIALRVGLSFLPLVLSQGLCLFTFLRRMDSPGWREGSAVFMSLSVFAVIALIGQIFHLPGDFGGYVITCGLLSLPVVYILNAASPLIIYYYAIIYWSFDSAGEFKIALVPLALGLFVLALPYATSVIRSNKSAAKTVYVSLITLIAGFLVLLAFAFALQMGALALLLLYFVLLLAFDRTDDPGKAVFYMIGLMGAFTLLFILSYKDVWDGISVSYAPYLAEDYTVLGIAALLAIGAVYFAVVRKAREPLTSMIVLFSILIAGLRLSGIFKDAPEIFAIGTVAANLLIFASSLYFIVRGSMKTSFLDVNIGMIFLCLLIVLRFFDWNLDFLLRGIIFVLLGVMFLAVNLYLVKKRKGGGLQ